MSRKHNLIILALVFVGFLGAFISGFFLKGYFDSKIVEFPILNQAYNILINHSYFSLPDSRRMEYGMIRGLLDSAEDPYASFQEPVQHELESNNLQGAFGGIGTDLYRDSSGKIRLLPIVNGPAYKAGILAGDQLIQIDDLDITDQIDTDEITAALRGPVGSSVHLKVIHENENTPLDFELRRDQIHLPSVTYFISPEDDSIGILRVNIIADSTSGEIEAAILQMQQDGASNYILDLRDNGGGLLTAGIEGARLFLSDGVILKQQYRGQPEDIFRAASPGRFSDLPLAILINRNTASAAEIIAGSMQVHSRAVLIGEPSFGKDTIQLIFDLEDGSSVHVTAAKWWIPGLDPPVGESGLQPDILIVQEESQSDLIMQAAIEYFSLQ